MYNSTVAHFLPARHGHGFLILEQLIELQDVRELQAYSWWSTS